MNFTPRQMQILECAIKILAEKGIEGLTIKALSSSLNVTDPAIYRHFKNKYAILASLLKMFRERASNHADELTQLQGSALDLLRELFMQTCSNFEQRPYFAAVVFSEEMFRHEPELSKTFQDILTMHLEVTSGLIRQGQEEGSIITSDPPESLAHIFLGTMRLLVKRWYLASYAFSLSEHAEQYSSTLLALLRK